MFPTTATEPRAARCRAARGFFCFPAGGTMIPTPVKPSLRPLTPRQEELLRIIQGFSPDRRYTVRIVCRGDEPWEIQEVLEHRKVESIRPGGAA